ncbi:LysR family transcriptional regulator [Psychromonas sp. Urea-02u-13]|uniref:LysR family transcriptional regulator n=1 Tax=Psychromonas sp. Urea-02u-13 TaxID=2058326 RepID=UPI000C33A94C|nr:LysR family transcriptional regulator [Psychromonas sp. Urea-02u-13]PKG37162.1 LysR family transcriptional regulator [Psychromonas sp. Urea-02u-13]
MLIEDLQVILKVAEFRSITGAAESLDMRTATASAAVKRVEASLGVELFLRSTRRLRLSAAGERYLPQCEQALKMLCTAKQSMKDELDIVDGELRIAISSDLGRNMALPWLDEFMEKHPKVSIRVSISDSNIDFYRDSVDVALRYGSPTDASVYGFKICDVPGILCAAPDYLKKHGTPSHPAQLNDYNGLFYQMYGVVYDQWEFTKGDEKVKVKMTSNRISNDADLVRRWCVAGHGFATKSSLDMSADLLAGRLVNVLPEYQPRSTELWLVCSNKQSITPAVRLLRDTLRIKCSDIFQQMFKQGILKQPPN